LVDAEEQYVAIREIGALMAFAREISQRFKRIH
jgi:hypothetical protein